MRYIALNGLGHPLDQYFNDRVECVNVLRWTRRNAENLIRQIDEPVTLIGFSMGATAVLHMVNESDIVHEAYAHSPMYVAWNGNTAARLTLFRTTGDTTPTYKATWDNHLVRKYSTMIELAPLEHIPVTDWVTWTMRRRVHQFHNCLPFLPPHIVSDQWKHLTTAST